VNCGDVRQTPACRDASLGAEGHSLLQEHYPAAQWKHSRLKSELWSVWISDSTVIFIVTSSKSPKNPITNPVIYHMTVYSFLKPDVTIPNF
jgi:hypothetical protein